MEFHYSKTKTLRWNAKVILFIQIYTFLDSDFSTLIENVNNFLFSQDFCAKSSGKLTWKINHGYSPLKQFCPNVVRVISCFDGDKDNHTILFFCVQNGWAGGHWSSLRKFYGRNHDLVDRYGISVSQMTTDMFHLSQALPGPFLVHDLWKNTN